MSSVKKEVDMKKVFSVVLVCLSFSLMLFAEGVQYKLPYSQGKNDVSLEINKTDYGIEVSNVDEEGNTICNKKVIIVNKTIYNGMDVESLYYLDTEETSINDIDQVKDNITNGKMRYSNDFKQYKIFERNGCDFCEINEETNEFDLNQSKEHIRSFVFIPLRIEILECKAYCKKGDMVIEITKWKNMDEFPEETYEIVSAVNDYVRSKRALVLP